MKKFFFLEMKMSTSPYPSGLHMLADVAQLQRMTKHQYSRVPPLKTLTATQQKLSLEERYKRLGQMKPITHVTSQKPKRASPEYKKMRKAYVDKKLVQEERRLRQSLSREKVYTEAALNRAVKSKIKQRKKALEEQYDTMTYSKALSQMPSLQSLRPSSDIMLEMRLQALAKPKPHPPAPPKKNFLSRLLKKPAPSAAKTPSSNAGALREMTNMKRFLKKLGYQSSVQYSSGSGSSGQQSGDQGQSIAKRRKIMT